MAVYEKFQQRRLPKQVSDIVPWRHLAAPGVILQKQRHALQRSYLMRGQDLQGETPERQGATMLQANNVIKRLGGQWMLQSEAQRSRLRTYPSTLETFPVAALIDADRRQTMLTTPGSRVTTYYLTLTWQPPGPALSHLARVAMQDAPAMAAQTPEGTLQRFLTEADYLMHLLGSMLALSRPLTTPETYTYLHSTVSDRWHPVGHLASALDIDAQLCDTPFVGGWYPQLGTWHLRTCSLLGFPAQSTAAALRQLETLDMDFRWCTRWCGLERVAQKAVMQRMQHSWLHQEKTIFARMAESLGVQVRIIDSDATRKAEQIDAARQEIGADIVAYGDFTTTVTVWDSDETLAEDKLREVMQVFTSEGFTVTAERKNAEAAWRSSHPGNKEASVRRSTPHSLTLAHLAPGFTASWPGPERDTYLNGGPWFLAHTDTSSVVRIVQHVRDVGHFLMFGATGMGKSTLAGFLVAQWFARYPGVQCFWWDMDRTARLLTLLLGGHWYDLGAPGVSFQPLRHVDDPLTRSRMQEWLQTRIAESGQPITGEVQAHVTRALRTLGELPMRQRRISELLVIMASQARVTEARASAGKTGADGIARYDPRLQQIVATYRQVHRALEPYTQHGEFGSIFDADHDDLVDGPLHTFEQRSLYVRKRLITPVTEYVFGEVEQRFSTECPTLMPMDEAAITAAIPAYEDKYDEWLMTTRKKSVSLGFLINALHQITGEGASLSALGRMLEVNCPSRYFLSNPEALTPAMQVVYRHFGLTEAEMRQIALARPTQDLYYASRELGRRLCHLTLSPFILDCVARNTEADHALIDDLLAQEGQEGFAAAWFRHHGYSDAAEACERKHYAEALLGPRGQ